MSPLLGELETVLEQLIAEHRRLLAQLDKHQAAMKALDAAGIEQAGQLQQASRTCIAALEQRRRTLVTRLAPAANPREELTLKKLAELYPARSPVLLRLRAELRAVVEQITARARISAKLAAAVLGHLNTVVRLLAGAVERAGLYTKDGTPQVSNRIGMMEAVG